MTYKVMIVVLIVKMIKTVVKTYVVSFSVLEPESSDPMQVKQVSAESISSECSEPDKDAAESNQLEDHVVGEESKYMLAALAAPCDGHYISVSERQCNYVTQPQLSIMTFFIYI